MMDEEQIVEMIGWTPAEFFPYLLVIGFLIGAAITGIIGYSKFESGKKDAARTRGERISYGVNYLTQNVATIAFCGAISAISGGVYYKAVEAEPTFAGCLAIGAVVALCLGLLGEAGFRAVLEGRRDSAKADEALSGTSTTTTKAIKKEE